MKIEHETMTPELRTLLDGWATRKWAHPNCEISPHSSTGRCGRCGATAGNACGQYLAAGSHAIELVRAIEAGQVNIEQDGTGNPNQNGADQVVVDQAFVDAVEDMRDLQRRYVARGGQQVLGESKRAEQQVDRHLENMRQGGLGL